MSEHRGSYQYNGPPGGSQTYAPPRDSYSGYDTRDTGSSYYGAPPGSGTYRPPTDEGYRTSAPSNMQVTQYDDDYDRRPRSDYTARPPPSDYDRERDRRYADDEYYDSGRPRSRHSRRSSRGSRGDEKSDRGEHSDRGHQVKSIGATLAGGAAGLWAGREFSKRGGKHHDSAIPAVVGALVGAWGAHKLEEKVERSKSGKRDKSRNRSQSRGRRSEYDDESLVDDPREGPLAKIKRSVSRSLSRFRNKSQGRPGSDDESDRERDDRRRRRSRRDDDY